MSKEDLLKPRFKVVADWPRTIYSVGEIVIPDTSTSEGTDLKAQLEIYPHLFKKLEWWEERKEEEMPEYVKYYKYPYKEKNKIIVHVDGKECRHEFNKAGYFGLKYVKGGGLFISDSEPTFVPATKEEYENQKL